MFVQSKKFRKSYKILEFPHFNFPSPWLSFAGQNRRPLGTGLISTRFQGMYLGERLGSVGNVRIVP
jgi:hypothetical protein